MGFNWQGALDGGVKGGTAGTAVNPGYGTAIGAVIGALLGAFRKKDKKEGEFDTGTIVDAAGNIGAMKSGGGKASMLMNFMGSKGAGGSDDSGGLDFVKNFLPKDELDRQNNMNGVLDERYLSKDELAKQNRRNGITSGNGMGDIFKKALNIFGDQGEEGGDGSPSLTVGGSEADILEKIANPIRSKVTTPPSLLGFEAPKPLALRLRQAMAARRGF